MKDIRKILEEEEGCRNTTYFDTDGNPTIGIGHLQKEGDPIYLSNHQISLLFNEDLSIAISSVEKAIGADVYSILNGNQKCALINMAFNLGYPRFSKFKNMIRQIRAGNYKSAAEEILNSKAARQLPKRYKRIYNLFLEEV